MEHKQLELARLEFEEDREERKRARIERQEERDAAAELELKNNEAYDERSNRKPREVESRGTEAGCSIGGTSSPTPSP